MQESLNKIVSIIVITAGKGDYLRSCLDSLGKQTYTNFEIIVIDNSFDQNLKRQINERYPHVKLCAGLRNLFYCEALNKGIDASRGNFILCLNDDVILDKGFIEQALKGFSISGKIGMVSGKILRWDGKTLDSTGLFLSLWRSAKERGYGFKDTKQFEEEEYIFGVNGAAAFYRREMLESIKVDSGYFDADYHIFYEDLDIAWRAQNQGWTGYYVPRAIAYHMRGGTVRLVKGTGKPYARRYLNNNLHFDLIKNRYLTIIRNESGAGFLLRLPFILFYDIFAWSYMIFFKPGILKMLFLNSGYLKSGFKKRKLIKEVANNASPG